jgi:hypothetical protein
MTPKEKAREIVIKMQFQKEPLMFEQAKQCALIAVDELIYETQFEVPNVRQKYWLSVKQEIENI